MKITIVVKPNSKNERVERLPDGTYRVLVKASPIEGKANAALIRALASHFKIPQSHVRLLKGAHGRKKLVEVDSHQA